MHRLKWRKKPHHSTTNKEEKAKKTKKVSTKKVSTKKIDKWIKHFIDAHKTRLAEEETFMSAATPAEINLVPFIQAQQQETAALNKLIAVETFPDKIDKKTWLEMYHTHHPYVHQYAINETAFPTLLSQTADEFNSKEYAKNLFLFFHNARSQMLFEQALHATEERFKKEKTLLTCPEHTIEKICKEIFALMQDEIPVQQAYCDYVSFDKEKEEDKLHPSWHLLTSTSHSPELLKLTDKANRLPKMPRNDEELESGDYADNLAAFIKAARIRLATQAQAEKKAVAAEKKSAASQAQAPLKASPAEKAPPPLKQPSRMQWLLKHPLMHMLVMLSIASCFSISWMSIAVISITAGLGSLGYQMLRRYLKTRWINQAKISQIQYNQDSYRGQGFQAGFYSQHSYRSYIKSWFQPGAYILPAYFLGQYTANENQPLDTYLIVSTPPTPPPEKPPIPASQADRMTI